jgi:hypothetical protein
MESPLLIHQNVPNLRKWPEEIQMSLILTSRVISLSLFLAYRIHP